MGWEIKGYVRGRGSSLADTDETSSSLPLCTVVSGRRDLKLCYLRSTDLPGHATGFVLERTERESGAGLTLTQVLVKKWFEAAGPLVVVTTRGGLCADGPCGDTVTVDRDGHVRAAAKPPNDLGVLPADQLRTLATAIATTDFTALRSHPFTGQCPTAFDGQEIIVEFETPGGRERLSTCETDIDFGQPLFVALSTALGPFIALPTT